MGPASNIVPRPLFRKVLVANDRSEGTRKALMAANELAQIYEAELYDLTVEEHLPQYRARSAAVNCAPRRRPLSIYGER
jgi:nucleotide-binding universal stress UspA family protein